MTTRVRIGPSPTGEPHVGTAYIALFNLAFARREAGAFVLRVEDTDQERSDPEWERQIVAGLRWLGLDWDEGPDVGGPYGPYRQSERGAIYTKHAHELVERGHAYRCFASKEELDQLKADQKARGEALGYDRRSRDLPAEVIRDNLAADKPYVIRMKAPLSGTTVVRDRLRGDVEFDNAGIDDAILLKSDGYPTYHLANVVDDHLMEISHVIRAEEWISSTPKHVLLYEMFDWSPPEFIHMPLLRNADKSKISKRKNPVSILDYKQRGFHPKAVLNYLAMLGWTMPDGREVFTFEEFVENFSWDRVHLGGPTFDLEKFTWLNGKYFREVLSSSQLTEFLRDELFSAARIAQLVPMFRERIDIGEQFIPASDYFFRGEIEHDSALLKPKRHDLRELKDAFEGYLERLERHTPFDAETLESMSRSYAELIGWKAGDLFMPLRIAMTGRKASPPLFDVMVALGRAQCRRRMREAMAGIRQAIKEEAKKPKEK